MAKPAGRNASTPRVIFKRDGYKFVYFSREVMAERETFRRLAHRVVDLFVDSGRHAVLGDYVGQHLAYIERENVIKNATDFVQRVLADDS